MQTDNPYEQLKLTPTEEMAVLQERLEARAKENKSNPNVAIRLSLAADMVRSAKNWMQP